MSKFKASTRLTEINSIIIEQLRKEYNQISSSKFSLSEAFKQHYLNGCSHVVISRNANAQEFRKYNQLIVNLHTNLNRVITSDSDLNKLIRNTLKRLIQIRIDISPLLFESYSIETSKKPDFEVAINRQLVLDRFSKRDKQYTISFTQNEYELYKKQISTMPDKGDLFKHLLYDFFEDFTVYQKQFDNANIAVINDENLNRTSEYINKYVADKLTNETKLKEAIEYFVIRISAIHEKLITGSADLLEITRKV